MNCKNCKEKLSCFSCYCENCGEKGPSFVGWLKFYGVSLLAILKKRIWLTAIIAGALVITIGLGIWLNVANNIDLTDYVVTEVSGFNKSGSIAVGIDYEALGEKLLGKIPDSDTPKGYEKYVDYIDNLEKIQRALQVSVDRSSGLSNGDFYLVTVTVIDNSVFEELGIKLKKDVYKKAFEIGEDSAKFDSPIKFNVFDYIDVSFSGTNGYGSLKISDEEKVATLSCSSKKQLDVTVWYERSWYNEAIYIRLSEPDITLRVYLEASNSSYLSNGDTVELSLDENDIQMLAEYGLLVEEQCRTYQVTELMDYQQQNK